MANYATRATVYKTVKAILDTNSVSFTELLEHHLKMLDMQIDVLKGHKEKLEQEAKAFAHDNQ